MNEWNYIFDQLVNIFNLPYIADENPCYNLQEDRGMALGMLLEHGF